jgi:hypothetical protein
MPRRLACLMLFGLFWPLALDATPFSAESGAAGQLCRAAVAVAEREARLPARLMAAIAKVESGRRDPVTGTTEPWPWTINAEGRGSFFPTKAAAIAAVQELRARGVRSIDIGCMQVNLRHHPNAFATLDAAFDPLTNARYAARFLTELQSTRPDWLDAAAGYHSQTPQFAAPYRARVAAAWGAEQVAPAALQAARPPPGFRAPQPGGGFMLSNGAERLPPVPTSRSGGGRGLDAYRAAPIPLTGRIAAVPPRRL